MNKKVKPDLLYPINGMNVVTPLPYVKGEELQCLEAELKKLYSDLEASGKSLIDLGFNQDSSALNTLMVLRRHLDDILLQAKYYESMLAGVHKIEINLLKAYINK